MLVNLLQLKSFLEETKLLQFFVSARKTFWIEQEHVLWSTTYENYWQIIENDQHMNHKWMANEWQMNGEWMANEWRMNVEKKVQLLKITDIVKMKV